MTPVNEVSQLLKGWIGGDEHALDRLIPLVYDELRRLARHYMRRSSGNTLQTTALVNEVWLRLAGSDCLEFRNRVHFFALSAKLMRGILVDAARTRGSQKRGGGTPKINLDEALIVPPQRGAALIALDDALTRLAATDARKARIIELRFFGGLSVEEVAETLKISVQSVHRDWRLARMWLRQEMME